MTEENIDKIEEIPYRFEESDLNYWNRDICSSSDSTSDKVNPKTNKTNMTTTTTTTAAVVVASKPTGIMRDQKGFIYNPKVKGRRDPYDLTIKEPSLEYARQRALKHPTIFNLFMEVLTLRSINSSANGLPLIFKTDLLCIRIFWIVLFVSASGAGSYCRCFF